MARVNNASKTFAVFCWIAVATGLIYGALLYFRAGRAAARSVVPPPPMAASLAAAGASGSQASLPSSVENDYRALWTRLSYAEKDVSEMHEILALTMIISALFGVAIGINAYLGLKQTLTSAKSELNKVRKVTKDAKEEISGIRAQFPSVAKMDDSLRKLLGEVSGQFTLEVDWINSYYPSLSEQSRESILISELTAAGFRFFDLEAHKAIVSEIYQGLAIFFGSRYAEERRKKVDNRERHRERAFRYFEMAIAIDQDNIRARKDRAALLVLDETEEGRRLAMAELESIRSHGDEIPGILMNLGIIFIQPEVRKYDKGLAIFSGLIERTDWKGGPEEKQKYVPLAYYNRACALCRLAGSGASPEEKAHLGLAIEDLRLALRSAKDGAQKQGLVNQLREDVGPGKDLELLKWKLAGLITS